MDFVAPNHLLAPPARQSPRSLTRCSPLHSARCARLTATYVFVRSLRLLSRFHTVPCVRRSPESQRAADAGPERVPVRDGRRAAQGGRAAAAATAPARPDRVRQDDGGRRAGHADRLRATAGAAPDAAAERGLRGRGRASRVAQAAPGVPARVRAALVPGPPGQPAGRRRLAADARRPFPRPRGPTGAADVHQDLRVRRLMTTTARARPPCEDSLHRPRAMTRNRVLYRCVVIGVLPLAVDSTSRRRRTNDKNTWRQDE